MLTLYNNKKDEVKDYHLQLHLAATNGNVGLVKFALDHGAPMDSVVNGFLPLQMACISDNNLAVIQYLIDRGAQVNAQRWPKKHSADKSQAVADAIGSTALHVACANGCTKVVELLLRNDAQVDLKDKYGSRPRDIAIAKHHMEIVMLLDTSGGKCTFRQQERRSMDITQCLKSHNNSGLLDNYNERIRRQSLPAVFEDKSQSRRRMASESDLEPHQWIPNSPQPYFVKTSSYIDTITQPIDIIPELSSSISNSTTTCTPLPSPTSLSYSKKADWYSYGVLHHDGSESYLTSLERRAYNRNESSVLHSYDHAHQLKTIEYSSSAIVNSEPTSTLVPQKSLSTTAINTTQISNYCNLTMDSSATIKEPPSKAMEDLETKKSYWRTFGRRKSLDTTTVTGSDHHLDKVGTSKELGRRDMNTAQQTGQQRKPGFLARWTGPRIKK